MQRIRLTVLALALLPATAAAQATKAAEASDNAKMKSALSAAPAGLTADATVADWPATPDGNLRVLRAGTNGWTCLPDYPGTDGPDPMCLDDTWLKFIRAHMKGEPPRVERIGFGYMVAPHGAHGSNTDPFAAMATADNEWGQDPPHIMIAVPDPKLLEGLPTKRSTAGPWVMFRGTPYAHLMVPVEAKK